MQFPQSSVYKEIISQCSSSALDAVAIYQQGTV